MTMRPDVLSMLENEGLYIAFDPKHPAAVVPVVSKDGKLWSMRLDGELAPDRFLDRCTLHGPFYPIIENTVNRERG